MNAKALLIKSISDFIFAADKPKPADVIFIPGGPHPEPAELAAELYIQRMAPLLVPAGKYGVKLGKFSGVWSKAEIYCGEYQTECEFLTDVLMRCGVPREVILGEEKSMHTHDNAFLSRALTDANGVVVRRGIVTCKSFHARRCQMLYQLAYPEAEILVCPVDCYGITKDNWHTFSYGIDRVLGEVARCGNQFNDDIKHYLLNEEGVLQ